MNQGFYLARFTTTQTNAPATITFQGAPYTCPYDPAYSDGTNTFPFCQHILPVSGSLYGGSSPLYTSTYPIFDLGLRSLRDVVRIEITFKGQTTLAPNAFRLVLKNSLDQKIAPQPLPFDIDIDIPTGMFYETIFTAPVDGQYYLEVEMVGATMEALEVYNIIGSLTDGTILFNSMEILRTRTNLLRFIEIKTPGLISITNS